MMATKSDNTKFEIIAFIIMLIALAIVIVPIFLKQPNKTEPTLNNQSAVTTEVK